MFKWVIAGLAAFILIVIAISSFLAPNDLASCGDQPSGIDHCAVADVVIAVSGGDTAARAQSAIELYKNGWAKLIIFSGAAADPDSPSNAVVMKQIAINKGVPAAAILIEESSNTTRENAKKTKDILDRHHIKTAILTTSPYHERRALWEFERAAPTVRFRAKPASDGAWDLWYLKPTGWWRALSELIGIGVLVARGTL
ncbi:MAG: YdcF family protein [Sphaerimonospora mesophila]